VEVIFISQYRFKVAENCHTLQGFSNIVLANFDILLTVPLSIILETGQLNGQILVL